MHHHESVASTVFGRRSAPRGLPAWCRRLPVVRTYQALSEAQAHVAALKREVQKARDERDSARRWHTHVVSRGRLKEIAVTHGAAYRSAEPFPHVVLDHLFEPRLIGDVLDEFEIQGSNRARWRYTNRETERKYSTEDFHRFGPATRALITQLNAAPFVTFLEQLTGVAGLIPDPHLRGGGLHEIRLGGTLGIHADFNFYKRLRLYRRLNLLLYLNVAWSEAWGGDLELWDRAGTRCVRRIPPVFNRVVIFDTSNSSYHGHPHPLTCPAQQSRKSIALYYYTVDAPMEEERVPHSTIFLQTGRPAEASAGDEQRPAPAPHMNER